jgi:hypothetical protein
MNAEKKRLDLAAEIEAMARLSASPKRGRIS